MSNNPFLSIIIPSYKGEAFFPGILDMIFSQSFQDFELILVIDGLLDNSVPIIEEYRTVHHLEDRINLIVLETNQGLSAARNAGTRVAKGSYVHFMDVDDSINKDFYLNMVNAVKETGADVACSGMIYERIRYCSQIFKRRRTVTSFNAKISVTWVTFMSGVWRYLISLDLLSGNGIDFEEGRIVEDVPFTYKMMYFSKKVVTVPGSIYTYCYNNPSSITSSPLYEEKRESDLLHSLELRDSFAAEMNLPLPSKSRWLRIRYWVWKHWQILIHPDILKKFLIEFWNR